MALEAAAIRWSGIGIEAPLEEQYRRGSAPMGAAPTAPPPALTPRRVRKAAIAPAFEPG